MWGCMRLRPEGVVPTSVAHGEVAAFFSAFALAFRSFDGAEIARRYALPYMAMQGDGRIERFDTTAAVAIYFQRVLNGYREEGCRACRFSGLELEALCERQCCIASLNWELLDERGRVLRSWREAYNLRPDSEGALRIFASIDLA
jgi:hypothetical protein